MDIFVNTGNAELDAMLVDFAGLWKRHSGSVYVCSEKTIPESQDNGVNGYIVIVEESDWVYSTTGRTFLNDHEHCVCLFSPISFAALEEALIQFSDSNIYGTTNYRKLFADSVKQTVVKFEPARNSIVVHGKEIILTPTEFALFKILYTNRGEIVPRKTLIQSVWGGEISGNRCDVHMAGLRRKLTAVFPKSSLTSVRGMGYIFRP